MLAAELYAIVLVIEELAKVFPPRKIILCEASLTTMRSLKNLRYPFVKLIIQLCFRSFITLMILGTPSSESHDLTDQAASESASIFPPPNLAHLVQRYSTNHALRNQNEIV